MTKGRIATLASAGFLFMFLSSQAAANQPPVSGIVVFGDSLSDTGNAGARFSNGAVWVEHLAEKLGTRLKAAAKGGTNYAFGGARTGATGGATSLRAQVAAFLRDRGGRADPKALYIVYGGGNDLRAIVEAADPFQAVAKAADNVGGMIADLSKAGATRFLVPNLPDIGRIPEMRRRGPYAADAATALSAGFNMALAQTLERTERQTGATIHRLDVWRLLEEVAADPGAAGFSNFTEPCASTPACREPDRYLFWDSIHPTTAAHARLADAAYAALAVGRRP